MQKLSFTLRYHDRLDAEGTTEFLQLRRMMADAKREMVGRAFKRPVAEERADVRRELAVGVGVARRRDGAGERLTLRDNELERAVRLEPDGHHRNRAFLDVELDARAAAGLAMVLLERT